MSAILEMSFLPVLLADLARTFWVVMASFWFWILEKTDPRSGIVCAMTGVVSGWTSLDPFFRSTLNAMSSESCRCQ